MRLEGVRILAVLSIAVIAAGCAYDPNYRPDFRFPIEQGDIDEGRQAFLDLQCHQCHTVADVRLPTFPVDFPFHLELGGDIIFAKSDAELMTSIINPNHVISERFREQLRLEAVVPLESPMPRIENMTVAQLIDLVAFLDSRYRLMAEYYPEF